MTQRFCGWGSGGDCRAGGGAGFKYVLGLPIRMQI